MRTFIIRSFYMILLSLLSQRRWFSGVCNMSEENNECILNFYWKTSWENSWAYLIHKRLLLRLILEEFIWNLYIGFNSLRKAGLGSFIFRVIEFLDHLLRVQRKLYCVMLRCCFPRVGNQRFFMQILGAYIIPTCNMAVIRFEPRKGQEIRTRDVQCNRSHQVRGRCTKPPKPLGVLGGWGLEGSD